MTAQPLSDNLIQALLAALDEQIELLQWRRRQLESLATAIVRRDDAGLAVLIEEIEQAQARHGQSDQRLVAARAALAAALRMPAERLKLAAIVQLLPAAQAAALRDRREQIILLASALRQRHMSTSMLLCECARINQLLLESLIPHSQSLNTYDRAGADSWRPDSGLVDAEL